MTVRLDPRDIEAIARRVAERVGAASGHGARYVDAAQVARVLGVDRDWVYAHARRLGAIRLGGRRGRLRFDLTELTRALAHGRPVGPQGPEAGSKAARPGVRGDVDLLPYES